MGYKIKDIYKVEAFRFGIDYIPDWFMDEVTANRAILHNSQPGNFRGMSAKLYTQFGWIRVNYGDYITRIENLIIPFKKQKFEEIFEISGCDNCIHNSNWENEVEYGYNSPCTRCSRRNLDKYESKNKEKE